jgi:hypothetical protein
VMLPFCLGFLDASVAAVAAFRFRLMVANQASSNIESEEKRSAAKIIASVVSIVGIARTSPASDNRVGT